MTADSFPNRKDVFLGPTLRMFSALEPGIPVMPSLDPGAADRLGGTRMSTPEELQVQMKLLVDRYPLHPSAAEGPPALPVLPTLREGINFCACDNRMLCALVVPPDDPHGLELKLRELAWEQGIIGRMHFVRVTPEEWKAAQESGNVQGGEGESGIFLTAPNTWGLEGTLVKEIRPDVSLEELREGLHEGLHRFAAEWRKLDRSAHILAGFEKGIVWTQLLSSGEIGKLPVFSEEGPNTGQDSPDG